MNHKARLLFREGTYENKYTQQYVGREDDMSDEEIRRAKREGIVVIEVEGVTEIPVDAIMSIKIL